MKNIGLSLVLIAGVLSVAAPAEAQKPPAGFTSLFNGKDLDGWRGRQPNYNPAEEAKLSKEDAGREAGAVEHRARRALDAWTPRRRRSSRTVRTRTSPP